MFLLFSYLYSNRCLYYLALKLYSNLCCIAISNLKQPIYYISYSCATSVINLPGDYLSI